MKWSHCNSCHHEMYARDGEKCDWCGGSIRTLAHWGITLSMKVIAAKEAAKIRYRQECN